MQTRPASDNRRSFRRAAVLCMILIPSLGGQIVLGSLPGLALPRILPAAVLIWSTAVHLVLFELARDMRRPSAAMLLLASGLGFLILPGLPFLPAATEGATLPPLQVAAAWVAAAALALAIRAGRHLVPALAEPDPLPLLRPLQLGFAGLVLAAGFWLALSALPLLSGAAFQPAPPAGAIIAAAWALTAASFLLLGLAGPRHPAPPALLLAALAALAVLGLALAAPEIALLGGAGTTAIVLLVLALAGTALVRDALVQFGFGLALTGGALAPAAAGQDLAATVQAVFLLPMLALVVHNIRAGHDSRARAAAAGRPAPEVRQGFHDIAASWIAQVDFDENVLRFPAGTGRTLGYDRPVPFAEVFRDSDVSGVLDLMQALQRPDPGPAGPVQIRLAVTAPGQASPARRIETFEVHVLGNTPPTAWLALVSLRRHEDLTARVARYEKLLGEAVLREERLLSIASHELRTPIAILSMLTEELSSGMDWADVSESFDKTLKRIVSILDDLRAGSGTEGGQAAGTSFTIREMAQQVLDIFRPAAAANGIAILPALSEDSDLAIRCDFSRVFIALSKLVHNAIVHSKGTEVVLGAFLLKGPGGELTVTWQVSDDGIGIEEANRRRVFEPFESSGANPDDRPGLGLYTARKAIRLMGGDLVLHAEGKGSRFVLTHPARSEPPAPGTEQESLTMTDATPIYEDRSVLLVEDNKLVGEITSARLRKLFQRVDWAETGDGGLALFRANRYDLVVVDQLLPGMIGSELVREIRQTHKTLPIVGITASTMGSECRDLEEAGANYALEKPLSFAQLKGLAEEFFARDAAGKDGTAE